MDFNAYMLGGLIFMVIRLVIVILALWHSMMLKKGKTPHPVITKIVMLFFFTKKDKGDDDGK